MMPMSFKGAEEEPFQLIRLTTAGTNALSVKRLKQLLKRRGLKCDHFIEKREFREELTRSSPAEVCGFSRRFDKLWKASFIFSWLDSHRQNIEVWELVNLDWVVFFKHDGRHIENVRFHHSNKVTLPFMEVVDKPHWKLIGSDPRMIQIDQYPPLTPCRLNDDWGWALSNDFVVFYSVHYGCQDREFLFSKHCAREFECLEYRGMYSMNSLGESA